VTETSAVLATVIVVTWNAGKRIESCLRALEDQSLPRAVYRILVVDNGSADETVEVVLAHFPSVSLVRNDKNLGFAGGVAVALERTETPFAVLVNDDAVVDRAFLDNILSPMQRPEGELVGAVTAKVLLMPRFAPVTESPDIVVAGHGLRALTDTETDPDAVDLVNSTGNEVDRDGNGRDRDWLTIDGGAADPEVFGFCGAAAALRMSAVIAAGGLDPTYFLYYEDTDLSWRMRLMGFDIRYEESAVARHWHSLSSREGSPTHRFHHDRNRLLTLLKNAPAPFLTRVLWSYCLTTASVTVRDLPRTDRTRLHLKVLGSFVWQAPRALRQRRLVKRTAQRPIREVAAAITEVTPRRDLAYRPRGLG
jgi:GT2 family glycosyltransferase